MSSLFVNSRFMTRNTKYISSMKKMSTNPTDIQKVKACITIQSLIRGWVIRSRRTTICQKRKRHKPNNYKPVEEIKQDEFSDPNPTDTSEADSDSDYVQGSSEESEDSEDSEESEDSDSDVDL